VEHHEQCCTAAVTKQLEQSQELFADMTEAERIQVSPSTLRVRKAATSKVDPRRQQDWILKCMQGG
jgi:hypothetical protein